MLHTIFKFNKHLKDYCDCLPLTSLERPFIKFAGGGPALVIKFITVQLRGGRASKNRTHVHTM